MIRVYSSVLFLLFIQLTAFAQKDSSNSSNEWYIGVGVRSTTLTKFDIYPYTVPHSPNNFYLNTLIDYGGKNIGTRPEFLIRLIKNRWVYTFSTTYYKEDIAIGYKDINTMHIETSIFVAKVLKKINNYFFETGMTVKYFYELQDVNRPFYNSPNSGYTSDFKSNAFLLQTPVVFGYNKQRFVINLEAELNLMGYVDGKNWYKWYFDNEYQITSYDKMLFVNNFINDRLIFNSIKFNIFFKISSK